jgi:hypothetical protein
MQQVPALTFLAYAPEDVPQVESLARRLRDEAGVAVWFMRDLHAGDDAQEQMEQALLAAKVCVICIGGAQGEIKGWQNQQMRVAIMRRVQSRAVRVIPLLLPGVAHPRPEDLPLFLQLYEPVVFSSLDDQAAFQKLLKGILHELAQDSAPSPGKQPEAVGDALPVACADFELCLYGTADDLLAQAQLALPGSSADAVLASAIPVSFDRTQLLATSLDLEGYGRQLSAMLFADVRLQSAWVQARAAADATRVGLRLRLRFDGVAEALHSLRWELLQDPLTHAPIALSERVRLVRYLSSPDLTPIVRTPRSTLSALVAVANPLDLGRYSLAPIDAVNEVLRAREGLGADSALQVLAREVSGEPTTLEAILSALHRRPQILYLACHGTIIQEEPYLWLEDASGASDRLSATALARAMIGLSWRPPLVVLATCQSAGTSRSSWNSSALAPALARAGVAAVLGMQGEIPFDTVKTFIPAFFSELRRDGAIDRAVAAARRRLHDSPAWWVPALFLRLRDGNLWDSSSTASRTSAGG